MRSNCGSRNRLHGLVPSALHEVDNLFDHVFGSGEFRPTASLRAPLSVWEDENAFHVELDVPGVAQEDAELTFEKGVMNISVERKLEDKDRNYLHNERLFGKLTRSVALPDTVDPESIEAELTAGVLRVSVAKIPEVLPKRIEVKVN